MLQGEKVVLRALRRDDLELLCQFNNDVEMELAGGGDPPMPQSLERLQAEFDADVAKGGRNGAGFAIEADGRFIGQCALFNFQDTNRTAELGIGIGDKDYWGRGYGADAVRVLVDYGFRLRNLNRIFLHVNGANARAQSAYRKVGFVEEGRLRRHVWSAGGYDDLVVMGLLREEWAARAAVVKP